MSYYAMVVRIRLSYVMLKSKVLLDQLNLGFVWGYSVCSSRVANLFYSWLCVCVSSNQIAYVHHMLLLQFVVVVVVFFYWFCWLRWGVVLYTCSVCMCWDFCILMSNAIYPNLLSFPTKLGKCSILMKLKLNWITVFIEIKAYEPDVYIRWLYWEKSSHHI